MTHIMTDEFDDMIWPEDMDFDSSGNGDNDLLHEVCGGHASHRSTYDLDEPAYIAESMERATNRFILP